jgi:hypothetical protein
VHAHLRLYDFKTVANTFTSSSQVTVEPCPQPRAAVPHGLRKVKLHDTLLSTLIRANLR